MNRPITITICLLVAMAFGIGLVFPKYKDLKILQEQIAQKEAELRTKDEYFLNLNNLLEALKLERYSDSLSKIDTVLPADFLSPSFFDFLQKTSSENGLVLESIGEVSSKSSKEREGLKEYSLSLSLIGSYSSFKSFLLSLEKTARLIETESFSFASPQKENELFSFGLQIKFYSY